MPHAWKIHFPTIILVVPCHVRDLSCAANPESETCQRIRCPEDLRLRPVPTPLHGRVEARSLVGYPIFLAGPSPPLVGRPPTPSDGVWRPSSALERSPPAQSLPRASPGVSKVAGRPEYRAPGPRAPYCSGTTYVRVTKEEAPRPSLNTCPQVKGEVDY